MINFLIFDFFDEMYQLLYKFVIKIYGFVIDLFIDIIVSLEMHHNNNLVILINYSINLNIYLN